MLKLVYGAKIAGSSFATIVGLILLFAEKRKMITKSLRFLAVLVLSFIPMAPAFGERHSSKASGPFCA